MKPPAAQPSEGKGWPWFVLIATWLVVLPSAMWWLLAHWLLNIPFHPHWNVPFTVALIGLCLLAWVWALRKWLKSPAVRGTVRWPSSSRRLMFSGALASLLSSVVLASAGLTAAYAWFFDGDSSGTLRGEADAGCLYIETQLALHAVQHEDLSDIHSGPAVDSGLKLDRNYFDEIWFGRWGAENYYIEVHGEAPDYKGTIIYTRGHYWPRDDSSPGMKDYGLRISNLHEMKSERFERWSE